MDIMRLLGQHLTPTNIFHYFIYPKIKDKLKKYLWVDLYAGEGNLILPLLEYIPEEDREDFFEEHIKLYDVDPNMVNAAKQKAISYCIPQYLVEQNITLKDTLEEFPRELKITKYPVFHITNPPYLYIGYIKKHAKHALKYFSDNRKKLQDLYQVALFNDFTNGVYNMIYIIPSNFLFGSSVSNYIRKLLLPVYNINDVAIFEQQIFKQTGTNVAMLWFSRKLNIDYDPIKFVGVKINGEIKERYYVLRYENSYRAGGEFDKFVAQYKTKTPIDVEFYFHIELLSRNKGKYNVKLLDANQFKHGQYQTLEYRVNEWMYKQISNNDLFIRTVDGGKDDNRVGLYNIRDVFDVDGIVVTKNKYRTHPIQLRFKQDIDHETQDLLRKYFNLILEYLRQRTDSDFMTTYKYSNAKYTRKYLGLIQAKKIIQTFPWNDLSTAEKESFKHFILDGQIDDLINFLEERR